MQIELTISLIIDEKVFWTILDVIYILCRKFELFVEVKKLLDETCAKALKIENVRLRFPEVQ